MLQLGLPARLDLVLNLLLGHCPKILSQDLARRALGYSFNKHDPSSQLFVIGDFSFDPRCYLCGECFLILLG